MTPNEIISSMLADENEAWREVNEWEIRAKTLQSVRMKYEDEIKQLRPISYEDIKPFVRQRFEAGMINRIELIKEVRATFNLGLKDAKDHVGAALQA